jgi:hypothetical protein
MTQQQKDEDDGSVCVALSLFALVLLALMRFSSSLSSKISESSLVFLDRSKAVTRLSVLILCSRTSRVLALSRLSFLPGIEAEQTVVEEGGRRQVWFGLAKEGVREGIQKGRRDSREERPMI